jgi:transcriptional regulator with XRE-family HTH domain
MKRRPAFVHVCRETFYIERRTAGMSQPEAARYLGVTVRTIRNWENGSHRIPYPAFRLIRMRAGGIVHVPGWEGWKFSANGALFSPDGRSFQPWQLQQLRLVFSMAEHFRRQHQAGAGGDPGIAGGVPAPRLRVVGGAS